MDEKMRSAVKAANPDMAPGGMPAKRFYDREYATEWRKERDWLAERGFQPTYVKRLETGIERYKYRKTSALFEALAVFYQMEEAARQWWHMERSLDGGRLVESGGLDDWQRMTGGDMRAAVEQALEAAEDEWEDDTV